MSAPDLIGLLVSYIYAGGLLILAELLRRWRGYPQDFTRKFVHICAGMWVFGVLALFETWVIGIIPFASFILLNYLFYRYRLFRSIDAEGGTPGTVYFALAITLLFLLFWRAGQPGDLGFVAAAGVMAMTWGDSMASIVGQRWGRRRYTILGSTRSLEGSLAMFGASALAMLLTLLLLPGSALAPANSPLAPGVALVAALGAALVATGAEAASPAGGDNLSVPLLAALVVFTAVTALG